MSKRILLVAVTVLIVGAAFIALRGRPVPVDQVVVARQTVREYILEDAKTRLAENYIVDMPVSGTLERIELEVGDRIERGQVIAQIDQFDLESQVRGMEALIDQARAQTTSVDVTKPKPEDIESARARVNEATYNVAMVGKERAIVEINHAEAGREFRRIEKLSQEGAVSQSRFDETKRIWDGLKENLERVTLAESAARKALEVAQLGLKRVEGSVDDNEYLRDVYLSEIAHLEEQLGMLRHDLEKTAIQSPVAGFVLEKYIEDRRVLMAGTPLIKLGDLETIEIEADILSEEVGRIELGDPVEITGKALGNSVVMGSVKRVYPSGFMKISALGVEQQRVRVIIGFDPSAAPLRPGTTVDIRIITDERQGALAVPERAAFRHEDRWYVFTVRDNKWLWGARAYLTPVEVGLKNDDWAEIVSGLAEGDRVLAETKNDLEDGARVVLPKANARAG